MERYVGMDVHAASCTLAVISDTGRRLRDFPVETNGQALGRSAPNDSRPQAAGLRGGSSACLAVRDAESSRGRDRGGWDHGESRSEERKRDGMAWPRSFAWGTSTSGSSKLLISLRACASSRGFT